MTRRSPGEGSVFFDASRGCWVGTIDAGRDPVTGKRRRPKVSGPTKTECRRRLDALRRELARTGTVAPRNTTVEQVVRALLASPPASWRSPITVQVNTDLAERIIAALGRTPLVKLTPGQVRGYLEAMARDGYATTTIGQAKGLLGVAIRRAEQDGLVGRNVATLADTPRGTVTTTRAMTPGQVSTLLASELTPWLRAYVATGILCGLRPGELLGLTWPDVDLAAGVLRVRHCLKVSRDADGAPVLVLAELKTDSSRRTLVMPARTADALRALRTVQAADRLRLGPRYGTLGVVFASPDGRPMWRATAGRMFGGACEAAGLGGGWTAKTQRHTFVSVLSDAGVDIEEIADAAGHVNSNVTRTVYRHGLRDKLATAARVMDDIFGLAAGS